ncbi:MAG: hypothetical protein QFX33_05095 [Candidatus Nezhaarchaeota archaeon]|nr:hypothetical protein [Candidatus Nezhaarchaeota archaeon]
MKMSVEGYKRALIYLSVGLEPVIFAVVGWYSAPYLGGSSLGGALVGVIIGFCLMFWNIWRLGLSTELKSTYEVESEKLRGAVSLVERERYKLMRKSDILKIAGTRGDVQLLNILKSMSLLEEDFYELDKLNEVTSSLMDFSHIMIDVRARIPLDFMRALDKFSDFLTLLSANFAFKHEVEGDAASKAFVVLPLRTACKLDFGKVLLHGLKDLIIDHEVQGLYQEALEEALALGSRSPVLVVASYSLALCGRELEKLDFGRAYAHTLKGIANNLYSIAITEVKRKRYSTPKVIEKLSQKDLLKFHETVSSEYDVISGFSRNSYRALTRAVRLPLKAETVISYLMIRWCEKVSLKLAFMASRGEISAQMAYNYAFLPL